MKARKKRIAHEVDTAIIKENVKKFTCDNEEDRKILFDFSVRLNLELKKQKITQEDFATTIGVSDGAISNYRSGKRLPPTYILGRIVKALNVSTDYLLGFTPLKSNDDVYRKVYELTGLTDNAIKTLGILKETIEDDNCLWTDQRLNTINTLIENEVMTHIFDDIGNFLWSKYRANEESTGIVRDENSGEDMSLPISMLNELYLMKMQHSIMNLKEKLQGSKE